MVVTIERLGLALCLAVVLPIVGFGQSDPALKKAADARQAAQWAGNAEEWGKYTTDDFLVTGADGVVKTKQQRMTEIAGRSEEHTSELQSLAYLVCRLLLE